MSTPRKKLIEVSIPLEAINAASAREKSIRHGHPSTLHLWWARRPLAACRAVLFAQLVDDPSAWPEKFPTEEAQAEERRRLHDLIARMVPWESLNDEAILNEARWEIARSVAWSRGEEPPPREQPAAVLDFLQTNAPPVYDPFSGGGSIPLEAQRLGVRAYGSDLNPVAVLIGKALVEIPPKFAGRPPVNPEARDDRRLVGKTWRGTQGLAEDVRWYGQWLRSEAEKRVGHRYPKAALPDGSQTDVIAWLWARTVRSPDPAARGAMVPLISSWMLANKAGRKVWISPRVDSAANDGYRFVVESGDLSKIEEDRLKLGSKAGKGQAFLCILTGTPIERSYIQAEGKAGRLGMRLTAIVAAGIRGRIFLPPTADHEEAAFIDHKEHDYRASEASFLDVSTPTRAMITGGICSAYGLITYERLFTIRQMQTLIVFSDLISEARQKAFDDAVEESLADDGKTLSEGGAGAEAYADSIATYLALAVDRSVMGGNSLTRWNSVGEKAQHAFGRQGLPMVWDFAETNLLGEATGSLESGYEMAVNALLYAGENAAEIRHADAASVQFPVDQVVVSTDPPYYDNINYADLSDFFYLWLRRSLSDIWPSMFRRITTPKAEELFASAFRHGGKAEAEAFFMTGMKKTLSSLRNSAQSNVPLTIYYAFKQSEVVSDGVTSAGWASFLQAVIESGFMLDGTWPIRTEMASRMVSRNANALASTIVLVCRKRSEDAPTVTRAEFLRELRRDLPRAMKEIIAARVGPVDLEQAVIGPGMGVFSRYAKVQEDDDNPMSVRTALALINRVRLEVDAETGNFDAETHAALAWFNSHGYAPHASGEAILLANSKGVSLDALLSSGVFQGGQGKVRLVKREELPADWSPATDKTSTIWECVQHTARALDQGGSTAAAALIKAMRGRAEDALSLAYRLYDIANAKGDAAEARVYAELAAEWPDLEAVAANLEDDAAAPKSGSAQASLFA